MKTTITGLPGAGKTSLLHKLADFYKTKPISIGDLRGEFAQKTYNETIDELNERRKIDLTVDTQFDGFQKQYMKENSKFVIEGRLSYLFAPKGTINIFLIADKIVRAERVFIDQRQDEKKCKTLLEMLEMIDQRIQNDIETYQKLYQTNCYDASNFDLVIDTSIKNAEEIFNHTLIKIQTHKNLLKKYNLSQ